MHASYMPVALLATHFVDQVQKTGPISLNIYRTCHIEGAFSTDTRVCTARGFLNPRERTGYNRFGERDPKPTPPKPTPSKHAFRFVALFHRQHIIKFEDIPRKRSSKPCFRSRWPLEFVPDGARQCAKVVTSPLRCRSPAVASSPVWRCQ